MTKIIIKDEAAFIARYPNLTKQEPPKPASTVPDMRKIRTFLNLGGSLEGVELRSDKQEPATIPKPSEVVVTHTAAAGGVSHNGGSGGGGSTGFKPDPETDAHVAAAAASGQEAARLVDNNPKLAAAEAQPAAAAPLDSEGKAIREILMPAAPPNPEDVTKGFVQQEGESVRSFHERCRQEKLRQEKAAAEAKAANGQAAG